MSIEADVEGKVTSNYSTGSIIIICHPKNTPLWDEVLYRILSANLIKYSSPTPSLAPRTVYLLSVIL